MATVKIQNPNRYFGSSHPVGNKASLCFTLAADSEGAALNANSRDPLEDGDVIVLGMLPGGMRLEDCQVIISKPFTADVTGSIGFDYPDGDDADVPADDAYFGAALDLATVARLRAETAKLVTLPKPARLILTLADKDNEDDCKLDVLVSGEIVGMR